MSVMTRPVPATPPEPILPFTVKQYQQMVAAEILTNADNVELLEGWLARKMPQSAPHVTATHLVRDLLAARLPTGWIVNSQSPITTLESEPEPDVTLVRGEPRDFGNAHPRPADIGLAVEVSDSTLERDRTWKQRIYARASIPNYWIVNLVERQIEVFSQPSGPVDEPAYRSRVVFRPGEAVPVLIGSQEFGRIEVAELLP